MKRYTDEELIDFFKNKLDYNAGAGEWDYTRKAEKVTINQNTEKLVEVEATAMYDAPRLGFQQLKQISEFFGTENVDKYDDISWGGCETCDYGSSYGFVVRIW